MQPRIRRRVATIAIMSIVSLLSIPADADARTSSRSRSHAATHRGAVSSSPGGYMFPDSSAGNIARGSTGTTTDWTAGWGEVGAR